MTSPLMPALSSADEEIVVVNEIPLYLMVHQFNCRSNIQKRIRWFRRFSSKTVNRIKLF